MNALGGVELRDVAAEEAVPMNGLEGCVAVVVGPAAGPSTPSSEMLATELAAEPIPAPAPPNLA